MMTLWKGYTGVLRLRHLSLNFHALTVMHDVRWPPPCKLDVLKEVYMHLLCWPTPWPFILLISTPCMNHFCGRPYKSKCSEHLASCWKWMNLDVRGENRGKWKGWQLPWVQPKHLWLEPPVLCHWGTTECEGWSSGCHGSWQSTGFDSRRLPAFSLSSIFAS